jgi:hypothetical protein
MRACTARAATIASILLYALHIAVAQEPVAPSAAPMPPQTVRGSVSYLMTISLIGQTTPIARFNIPGSRQSR